MDLITGFLEDFFLDCEVIDVTYNVPRGVSDSASGTESPVNPFHSY